MIFFNTRRELITIKNISPILVCVAAGTALGVSVINIWLWPLVILGTALTLISVIQAKSIKNAFLYGWLIGIVKILWSLIWFWSVYPVDWIGLEPGLFHIVILILYWVPAAMTLGVGLGYFGWVYKKYISSWPPSFATLFILSFIWMISEGLGAIVFSIYTLGPGSDITLGFSFGHTGYALIEHGLLSEAARIGGVYTLSFLVGLISFALVLLKRNTAIFLLLIFVITAFTPSVPIANKNLNLKVALVGTEFSAPTEQQQMSQEERWQVHFGYMKAAIESGSDVIVLPEDMRLSSWFASPEEIFDTYDSLSDKDVIIIDSIRAVEDGKTVLQAQIYDTKTRQVYKFDKQYLVPQGEYIPFVYQGIISLLDPSGFLKKAISETAYFPGVPQSAVDLPDYIPPVLFCFESVTPFGVKNIIKARSGAPFVAHLVSHAWFKREPEVLWHQLDAMLRAQALDNNVIILQAANKAPVKAFYPNGQSIKPTIFAEGRGWSVSVIDL